MVISGLITICSQSSYVNSNLYAAWLFGRWNIALAVHCPSLSYIIYVGEVFLCFFPFYRRHLYLSQLKVFLASGLYFFISSFTDKHSLRIMTYEFTGSSICSVSWQDKDVKTYPSKHHFRTSLHMLSWVIWLFVNTIHLRQEFREHCPKQDMTRVFFPCPPPFFLQHLSYLYNSYVKLWDDAILCYVGEKTFITSIWVSYKRAGYI